MKIQGGFIYILTNKVTTVLYIGVTSNLIKRAWEHKEKFVKGFSQKYNLTKLVYYEKLETIKEAIAREKQLKNWKREWKDDLIRKMNPNFEDLYNSLL